MRMTRIEELERNLQRDHRNAIFTVVLGAAVILLLLLASCAHIGVVGVEPHGSADPVLDIVGPTGTDPATCESPRFVDDPTTHYAIDDRCDVSKPTSGS